MVERMLDRIRRQRSRTGLKRGWRCPEETELAGYAEAQLGGSAKERLEHHLADCGYCRNQVAALLRLQAEAVPSEVPAALLARARELAERAGHGSSLPLLRWGTIAAAACLALVVATTYRQPVPSPPLTPSRPAPPAALPSTPSVTVPPPAGPRIVRNQRKETPTLHLLYPREGAVVAPKEVEFRWKRVPGTLYYDIRIVTDEGDLIWEGRADQTRVTLPSDIHLQAGQEFFVRIRAQLPEGKTVSSRVVGFKVKNSS